jgi:single-strand DNA-binding protein
MRHALACGRALEGNHMSNVNKLIVVGNLGADPELKYIDNGQAVAKFSVATSEHWKTAQGEEREHTEWHRVTVWGKAAEACAKFLGKGRQVYVEGRVRSHKWTDKEGKERWSTELIAEDVKFLGGAPRAAAEAEAEAEAA